MGAAAAGAIGGLFGGLMSAVMSAAEAKKQRDFIERMENTRYQRTMNDMRMAGLNPLLAYKQGAGSTSPGGIAQVPDLGRAFSGGMTAGASAKDVSTRSSLAEEQKKLLRDQQGTARAQATMYGSQGRKAHAEAMIVEQHLPAEIERRKVDQTPEGRTMIRVGRAAELGAAPIGSAVGAISPWRSGSK